MTVRIFGAEEDKLSEARGPKNFKKIISRSVSDATEPSSYSKKQQNLKKRRSCKSVSSLDEVRKPNQTSIKTSLRRHCYQQLRKKISNSLSPDQSGDEKSPIMSPKTPTSTTTLSPTTPDSLSLLRPESPTKGLGQFHKGRSSSIATTGTHSHMLRIRGNLGSRRFSVDSAPKRRFFRLFSKEMRKACNTPIGGSPLTLSPNRRSLDVESLGLLHHSRFGSASHRLSRELSMSNVSSGSTRSLNTLGITGLGVNKLPTSFLT